MNILQIPSPNFGDRKNGGAIDMIILHYTGFQNIQDWIRAAQDPAEEKSAHYAVATDGTVYQLVDDSKRAWHAGVSYWQGEKDINSCSIGIEVHNAGHEGGCPPYPEVQTAAVAGLCRDLAARYKIPAARILGHSDIAIGRKIDPGEHFPWEDLAKKGVGLWPDPTLEDQVAMDHIARDETQKKALFKTLGYDVSQDFSAVVTAFQRHWQPDVIGTEEEGKISENTLIRLKAVIRQGAAPA